MEQAVPDPTFTDPDLLPKNLRATLAWRDLKKNNPEQWEMFTYTIIEKEVVDFVKAIEFAESECKSYGKKMASVLSMDPATSKAKKGNFVQNLLVPIINNCYIGHLWDAGEKRLMDPRDRMVAKIKEKFLTQFEEHFKIEGNPTQTRDLRLLAASAYYCYVYLIHQKTYTFAWIPLKYLNEVKKAAADMQEKYITIPKHILEELLGCKLQTKD